VDRVRRRRHERGVAGLQQHPHQVAEPLLRADRREHVAVRVEVDAVPLEVARRDRLAQLRDAAAGGVPVVARVAGRLGELVDRDDRRRDVGVPEAEVDDVAPGPPRLRLQRVDDREDVRRQTRDAAELHVHEG
jgi:hypothetical protein